VIYLPLDAYDGSVSGVALPPVIFDSERAKVEKMLEAAVARGARHALVGNLGHLELAERFGLVPHGDLRLNVANRASASVVESLGFADFILSPELSLPKIRDIGGASMTVVYGRLPLMILEKCVGKELGGCNVCESGEAELRDRRGISFPVLREWEHRSLICNSLPTCLSDRGEELRASGVVGEHFIFTTETRAESAAVIGAYQKGEPLPYPVRRLPK
jgi:putative protease